MGKVKLNVDDSYCTSDSCMGGGGLVRDSQVQ